MTVPTQTTGLFGATRKTYPETAVEMIRVLSIEMFSPAWRKRDPCERSSRVGTVLDFIDSCVLPNPAIASAIADPVYRLIKQAESEEVRVRLMLSARKLAEDYGLRPVLDDLEKLKL